MNGQGVSGSQPGAGGPPGPLHPFKGRLKYFIDFVCVAFMAIAAHFVAKLAHACLGDNLVYYVLVLVSWALVVADAVLFLKAVVAWVAPGFYRRFLRKWFEGKEGGS